jgi:hypothetical protein
MFPMMFPKLMIVSLSARAPRAAPRDNSRGGASVPLGLDTIANQGERRFQQSSEGHEPPHWSPDTDPSTPSGVGITGSKLVKALEQLDNIHEPHVSRVLKGQVDSFAPFALGGHHRTTHIGLEL